MGAGDVSLDLDWVTPSLAVGGRLRPEAVPHLSGALKVRHVVDVREEACDDAALLAAHGLSLLHLPTTDRLAVSLPMLREGAAWVAERVAREERVLVHCEHGIGRSALVVLCVLVRLGDAPLEAMERAKSARRVVSPSPEQLGAFLTWCGEWREVRRTPWEVPTLEALQQISWRHLWAG